MRDESKLTVALDRRRCVGLVAGLAAWAACPALAAAPAFDRVAAQGRYRAWFSAFQDDHRLDAGSSARSVVPDSRASVLLATLATEPQARRLFLALLRDAVVAGDGGRFPEPDPAYAATPVRAWYVHVDGGGQLESYFNDAARFRPYHLPPTGVLTRNAYPFLLFEDAPGPLRFAGVSREFWGIIDYLGNLPYA